VRITDNTIAFPVMTFKNTQTIYKPGGSTEEIEGSEIACAFSVDKGDGKVVALGFNVYGLLEGYWDEFIYNPIGWFKGLIDVEDPESGSGLLSLSVTPNPIDDFANVSYIITGNMQMPVKLSLFNSLGQEVLILENGNVNPGINSALLNTSRLSSGNYYLVLKCGTETSTIPVSIIK
jgi:hypothetical protein